MKRPWLKFYPADWRADPRLRMCSLAARGLWIDLMTYMHEGEPYGHLTIDGMVPTVDAMAGLVGRPHREVIKALVELEARGVFDRGDKGVIISRRMVRDKARDDKHQANGKLGGNPNLKVKVNPPDKAQKLEARKKEDAAAPPSGVNPEKELYDRGKQVLGEKAGGLIAKLLKAKGGSIALARAAIEQASEKQNPREYVGRILNGEAPREGEFVWKSGIPGVL